MGTFRDLEEAREFMRGDQFAALCGIRLEELTEEGAVCGMTVGGEHRNAYGGVMGGAIFTLADFAFASLANHIHRPTVAQAVSTSFLSAPKGERLTARAFCRKNGQSAAVVNVDVSDETGRDVAAFIFTGFKL